MVAFGLLVVSCQVGLVVAGLCIHPMSTWIEAVGMHYTALSYSLEKIEKSTHTPVDHHRNPDQLEK
jgi:hypothetical protein